MTDLIELTDGGTLYYDPNFLPKETADSLLDAMSVHVPWKQEVTFYGNKFPRLTAYYADPGVKYAYSGVVHDSLEWPNYLKRIKLKIEEITGNQFNSLLLNQYRDGKDSIGWHADNEKELGVNPVIASVSIGAERVFQIRHNKSKDKKEYVLTNGSLLVMGGTMQHHWQHCVPKTTKEIGPRINLTFRNIK